MLDAFVFAGPSLDERACASAKARGMRVLPPAARNDVLRLAVTRPAGTIILADGVFHEAMAVGHAELREALERGWRVWGVSSMGAIRAFEMRFFGMRGWGRVYAMFERFEDFQDDEVALLHERRPPYRPASEPLVHLRVAAAYLADRGLATSSKASRAIAALKGLWYGDRTVALLEELLGDGAPSAVRTRIKSALSDFDRFRIKQKDLAALLAARSLWCVHGASPA